MKNITIFLFLSFIILSCGHANNNNNMKAESSMTHTRGISTIIMPTQTPLSKESFSIETISECQSINEISAENSRIILESTNHTYKLFTLNIDNFTIDPIIGAIYHNSINASPDKEWLLFTSDKDGASARTYMINTKSYENGKIFEFEEPWSLFDIVRYWLNDHQIILQKSDTPYDKITLFNPFTGEKQDMNETYPDIYFDDNDWEVFAPGLKIYDPSLSRVVYFSKSKSFIYWDIKKNEKINEYVSNFSAIPPTWSPNSNSFIFIDSSKNNYAKRIYKDEVIFVNWDGHEEKLTHFSEIYLFSQITGPLQWSPDGNHIAFYIDIKSTENADFVPMLAVVNVNTGDTKLYSCFSPYYWLTWSPNSKYIATTDEKNSVTSTYILRLIDDSIMKVGDNMAPLEWVK